MPPGVTFDFGGNGKMLGESIASMGLALFLIMISVYMILASQFDSFIRPFTIMEALQDVPARVASVFRLDPTAPAEAHAE